MRPVSTVRRTASHDVHPLAGLAAERSGKVALASVVGARGSTPRPVGTAMLIEPDGRVVGSLSGGCVEADVCARAEQVFRDGRSVLQEYGISDAVATGVGLTCGGHLEVLIELLDPAEAPVQDFVGALRAGKPAALVRPVADGVRTAAAGLSVRHDVVVGDLGDPGLTAHATADARSALTAGRSEVRRYGLHGHRTSDDVRMLMTVVAERPRMVVCGSTDFAAALCRQAQLLRFDTTAVDARSQFATTARLPGADEVVVDWPHRYLARELEAGRLGPSSAVCVLTHDPKLEDPALELLLRLPPRSRPYFIGAIGSVRAHERRVSALLHAGLTRQQLARLRSPIGLDLGGRTPEEVALSITAEVILMREKGSGRPLSNLNPGRPGR